MLKSLALIYSRPHLKVVLVPTVGLDGLKDAGRASGLVLHLAVFVAASAPVPARPSVSPLLDLQPAAANMACLDNDVQTAALRHRSLGMQSQGNKVTLPS